MGIARFYRWLSERYPLINEQIDAGTLYEFDNLYIDMNGIIHDCSHGNDPMKGLGDPDRLWLDVFKYISDLVLKVKPQRLIYLAVDGVAPRAKLNQQRNRRFRAASEQAEAFSRALKFGGGNGSPSACFDSNCISPGTEFMAELCNHLYFFVSMKMQEDPLWKKLTVILSGPDVPGEGEHKIMDYIRSVKSQSGYDANIRHCLYGLDADLIMLSLGSHELHFSLLREEIVFNSGKTSSVDDKVLVKKDKFQLLHISMLREYFSIDFGIAGDELEQTIDDFILFCFLVGNDFLPHLPCSDISEGGLNALFECYKKWRSEALIKKKEFKHLVRRGGVIDWENFRDFLAIYARDKEQARFRIMVESGDWSVGKKRLCNESFEEWERLNNKKRNYRRGGGKGGRSNREDDEIYSVNGIDMEKLEKAKNEYYNIKFGISRGSRDNVIEKFLEGLQWMYFYYFRGPPSWDWYYPYYHAPFAIDIVGYPLITSMGERIKFVLGKPFTPFQQLLSILPASSGLRLLPASLSQLMTHSSSPIVRLYPRNFQIDMDMVRVPWGGVALIPFVEEKLLLSTLADALIAPTPPLTEEEKRRNSSEEERTAFIFEPLFDVQQVKKSSDSKASEFYEHRHNNVEGRETLSTIKSTLPKKLPSLENISLVFSVRPYSHAPLPTGCLYFPHWVLSGADGSKYADRPSILFNSPYRISSSLGTGLRVFKFESKNESVLVNLHVDPQKLVEHAKSLNRKCSFVRVGYPYVRRAKLLSVVYPNSNNESLHEQRVQDLLEYIRNKGVTLEFSSVVDGTGSSSAPPSLSKSNIEKEWQAIYSQPLIEVEAEDGDLRKSQMQLACLVFQDRTENKQGIGKNSSENANSQLLFVKDAKSDLFGCCGYSHATEDFRLEIDLGSGGGVTRQEEYEMFLDISRTISRFNNSMKWYSISEMAKFLNVSNDIILWITGSVSVKFDRNVEEIGMNLYLNKKKRSSDGNDRGKGGDENFLCCPSFSRLLSELQFSDLALDALVEYMNEFPGVVETLKKNIQLKHGYLNFRLFFSEGTSVDECSFHLGKLASFLSSKPFKKVRLVSSSYDALSPQCIEKIEEILHETVSKRMKRKIAILDRSIIGTLDEFSKLKSNKLKLGDRIIYIGKSDSLPKGSRGTVVGILGPLHVEVLLDSHKIGAGDLYGRCSLLKGIILSPQDLFGFEFSAENRDKKSDSISPGASEIPLPSLSFLR